jgi:HSP20 family molecular chaperone IbpA
MRASVVRFAETLTEEVEQMYEEITRRACEIFQQGGLDRALDLEDWLTAEREVLEKPHVRIDEMSSRIVVRVYIAGLNALDIQVLVTPDAMLLRGRGSNGSKKLFRVVQFPRRIDAAKAEAHYSDGCLVLTA